MDNNDFQSTFSLLNADYVQLNKNWNYRNVISPFYRIYLIDEGYGSLGDADKAHVLEKGYLYLVPSFTLCNHHCPKHLSQFYIHVLEESADGTSLFSSNRKIYKIESTPEDIIRFKKILQLNPGRDLRRTDNPREYEKQPTLVSFQKRNNLIPLADYIETKGLILEIIARFLKSDFFKSSEAKKIPSKFLIQLITFLRICKATSPLNICLTVPVIMLITFPEFLLVTPESAPWHISRKKE